LRRFLEKLFFSTGIAAALSALHLTNGQTTFVVYLSVFALARILTEFRKLFLRVEPQEGFRIPTQIHWVKDVVHSPAIRFLFGAAFLVGIYGCCRLFRAPAGIAALAGDWLDRGARHRSGGGDRVRLQRRHN
jgi:hypothetical protein